MTDPFDDDESFGFGDAPAEEEKGDRLVSVDAEAAFLGGVMLDNRIVDEMSGFLDEEHFAEPMHQRIYSAIVKFVAAGREANPVTLRPVFRFDDYPTPDGRTLNVGAYLAVLTGSGASLVGARDFARQIVELARKRRLREALKAAAERVDGDLLLSIDDVTRDVEDALWSNEEVKQTRSRSMGAIVGDVIDRQDRFEAGETVQGAGNKLIGDLDLLLGPLEPGYIIIAGRPGMGKSVMGSSLALGYAANGAQGYYPHAEMTAMQMNLRVVADLSHAMGKPIEQAHIKTNKLTIQDRRWLDQVRERADLMPLTFEEVGPISVQRFRSKVKREKARLTALGKKLDFVVLDYLGLLSAEANGREIDDDRRRVNAVSKALKLCAYQEEITLFALCQLGRAVEQRADKRPMMSDLKESGNLEQDADAVLLLYRDEYYLQSSEPKIGEVDGKGKSLHEAWENEMMIAAGKIDIIAGKNRHGSRRTKTAKFLDRYQAIRSSTYRDYDDEGERLL